MSDVPELSPAEEAAARAKEQAEQDALPYKWTQTIGDVDITILVPGNLKGKDMVVEIKKQSLTAGIKGQEPIIKVRTSAFTYQPYLPTYLHVSTCLPVHLFTLPRSCHHATPRHLFSTTKLLDTNTSLPSTG